MIGYAHFRAGSVGGPDRSGLHKEDRGEGHGGVQPEFDQKWSQLAEKDTDVFYIEDDRGEG
jgi:hypothetical protein